MSHLGGPNKGGKKCKSDFHNVEAINHFETRNMRLNISPPGGLTLAGFGRINAPLTSRTVIYFCAFHSAAVAYGGGGGGGRGGLSTAEMIPVNGSYAKHP